MQILLRIFLLCTLVSLSSCSTLDRARNVDSLPESTTSIGDNGMVFAEVHILGKFVDAAEGMSVIVGGHSKGSVQKNSWAVALPAGDYTLEGFSKSAGGYGGGYGGVNVTVTEYESYAVHRTFTVKPGEITNLGEIIVVLNPDPAKSKEFKVFFVDNSSDAPLLLKAHYSKLDLTSKPEAITLSAGDYTRGDELAKLRVLIASLLADRFPTPSYVAGPAGTLARIDPAKSGTRARLRLIDTGMTAGFIGKDEDIVHDRFAFITSDGRLFLVRSGQIQPRRLPEGVGLRPNVLVAGDRNVVIPGRGFTFYTSIDDGMSWNRNDTVANKSDADFYTFAKDAAGYFIYHSYPPRIVYSPIGEPNLQPVTLPPQIKELRQVTALDGTIVLEGFVGAFVKVPAPFFVRTRDSSEWQQRLMPNAPNCESIQFLDKKGVRLRTSCGRAVYVSDDGGERWSPQG